MSAASYLRETKDGVYIALKVQPRASRNQLLGQHGNELRIAVIAPPVDSAANQAILDFLLDRLDRLQLPRSAVQLVLGKTSRHKTVFISGASAAEVERLLTGD